MEAPVAPKSFAFPHHQAPNHTRHSVRRDRAESSCILDIAWT